MASRAPSKLKFGKEPVHGARRFPHPLRYRLLAAVFLLIPFCAPAEITEGGSGVLFGVDHAFEATATPGWVLDNQSGIVQGLHMLFYPKQESWPDSPVIIYGRSVPTSEVPDVNALVANTIRDFHTDGNPDYAGTRQAPMVLQNGREAELYFYSGDQWGNYEAVVYIQEADTINYLVFTSRSKELFERHIQDFRQIAASYQNRYRPTAELVAEKHAALKRQASAQLQKPGGKEYEAKAVQAVGQTMANAMRDCTARMAQEAIPAFSYIVRIAGDGGVVESNIYPPTATGACFSAIMERARYPAHGFESFLLNIEMNVSP
jgi:hypothetical protein